MDNYRKSWLKDSPVTATNGNLKLAILSSLLSQAHVNSAYAHGRPRQGAKSPGSETGSPLLG